MPEPVPLSGSSLPPMCGHPPEPDVRPGPFRGGQERLTPSLDLMPADIREPGGHRRALGVLPFTWADHGRTFRIISAPLWGSRSAWAGRPIGEDAPAARGPADASDASTSPCRRTLESGPSPPRGVRHMRAGHHRGDLDAAPGSNLGSTKCLRAGGPKAPSTQEIIAMVRPTPAGDPRRRRALFHALGRYPRPGASSCPRVAAVGPWGGPSKKRGALRRRARQTDAHDQRDLADQSCPAPSDAGLSPRHRRGSWPDGVPSGSGSARPLGHTGGPRRS